MSCTQEFLKIFGNGLARTAVFTTFPLSLLSVILEGMVDAHFTCPCDVKKNVEVSNLIFAAPFFFFLAVMCLILQPITCKPECQPESKCNCNPEWIDCKGFFRGPIPRLCYCVFPSVVWIVLLLLDGDYIACRETKWNGEYILDDELHVKWCKPTEPGRNETELRYKTLGFIAKSQRCGFITLLTFSFVIMLGVCIYSCCCYKNFYICCNYDCCDCCDCCSHESSEEQTDHSECIRLNTRYSAIFTINQADSIPGEQSNTLNQPDEQNQVNTSPEPGGPERRENTSAEPGETFPLTQSTT